MTQAIGALQRHLCTTDQPAGKARRLWRVGDGAEYELEGGPVAGAVVGLATEPPADVPATPTGQEGERHNLTPVEHGVLARRRTGLKNKTVGREADRSHLTRPTWVQCSWDRLAGQEPRRPVVFFRFAKDG